MKVSKTPATLGLQLGFGSPGLIFAFIYLLSLPGLYVGEAAHLEAPLRMHELTPKLAASIN